MSIRLKILLPIFLAFIALALLVHYYWRPLLLENEQQLIVEQEKYIIHNSAPTFVRDLLWQDLGAIYTTLDHMRAAKDADSYQVELLNPGGKRLYPLTPLPAMNSRFTAELVEPLELEGRLLGQLKVRLDWSARGEKIERTVRNFELTALLLFGLVLLALLLVLEWRVNRPLINLKRASSRLAEGDFKTELPKRSRDEIGALTDSFENMRMSLMMQQQELQDKATEANEIAARFRSLMQFMPAALITIDEAGVIRDFNPAAENTFAYDAGQIIGQDFILLLPEKQRTHYMQTLLTQMETAPGPTNEFHTEYRGRRSDGSEFPMNLWINRMQFGEQSYNILIAYDVTEEREIEEQLLNAITSAEKANQAKTDFLSSMSHELRTPMNAILGFAQVLEIDPAMDSEQLDSVQEILKAGKHLLNLINEVLDLAKVESGHNDLCIEPVAIESTIDECLSLVRNQADARHIELDVEQDDSYYVQADAMRLKQALLNLLSNAIKYNHENGSVLIQVQPQANQRLRISVTDTGPGIEPERLHEVFQPFNRLSAENSDIEGTGVGLTLTRRIVEFMNGCIDVTSEPGQGSSFWIELPLSAQQDAPATSQATQ
ncbi:MAG: ATP-binding protein [Chromatiales bacterium]|jgi:PAS domain S-box-containing protein